MGEKFSDGAIVQHMSKLRQKMVENNLPVPPPLKRGTTVVPSKIYATSGTVRRKSMPDTPNNASTVVTTPKPKQSASKKRTRRSGVDSDSDSQPDEDQMDIGDTSDEEYGASGKKKKKQTKSKKVTKKRAVQEAMEVDDEDTEQTQKEDTVVESKVAEEETIKESIETPGPAIRTRGVRPDYSKLEQVSDEEDEVNLDSDDVKDGDEKEENGTESVIEDEAQDPRIKSDGEVSPRSRVPASPATPARLMVCFPIEPLKIECDTDCAQVLPTYQNTPHSGISGGTHTPYFGRNHQFQSPQHTLSSMPNFLPRSNMTSISTNRNDSASSLTSSMPQIISSQGSFSQPTTGQMPFSNRTDYFGEAEGNFNDLGGLNEFLFPYEGEDHDNFGGMFGGNRKFC